MQAIILCGGKGTRLSELYPDRPKALVPILGRPFIEWQIAWLARGGVTDVHLAAGYKAELLAAYVEEVRSSGFKVRGLEEERATVDRERQLPDGRSQESMPAPQFPISGLRLQVSGFRFPLSALTLSAEPAPLGTGGGLKFIEPHLRSDPFLVLNGDSLIPNLDLQGLEAAHGTSSGDAPPSAVTLVVTQIKDAGRYGTVEFGRTGRITAFREKAPRADGWINGGAYVMRRSLLAQIPPGRAVSLETDLFPALAASGLARAYPAPPPLLDMGTPAGIEAMEAFLRTHG
jgi:NDP-sugar pyrophosphorylase family protein